MDWKKLSLVFVLVLFGGVGFALTPMGPAVPDLAKGQWEFGVDYSYGKQDVQLNHGFSPGGGPKMTIDNLKIHYLGARGGYGINDNWEMFMRLGGGSIRGNEGDAISFNSNNGYAIGFGTKVDLFECSEMRWGGLFQILWAQADGQTKAGGSKWNAEENIVEVQFAIGPAYQMSEKVKLYGGPFFHLLDGDIVAHDRAAARRIKYDLDQGSWFGGYIGTQIDVMENTVFNIEYQHTSAADAMGMSLAYRF
ncbi:MAG: hypothetical protein JW837_03735 [Sedimentisphaerales bacterium]|nr:hypothetical protein [Sedimentisphaerales bacterium]